MGTSLYRTSLLVVACAIALPALADIYTWTDERGTTVISDTPPANARRVTDLQVVVREEKKSGKRAGARDATPTEQKLLDRIDNLERQVRSQSQTYSSAPAVAPSPPPAVSYYTTPPAPPAYYDPYYYDSGYYPGYYPSYYPSYYPAYSFGWPGAVIVGRSFVGHRHHGHFGNRAFVTSRGAVAARGRR
ncbi:MAG TPA: DUF4124 domain-containing protein [Burkholderiales bacterium]|nr:DUF4124 domain-containing protein [Burkholderiales bacterium]